MKADCYLMGALAFQDIIDLDNLAVLVQFDRPSVHYGIMQSPVVREHAGIPDDQVIMKAVAMGWPDASFPANAVVSERRSVDEATRFVGFKG